MDKNKHWDAQGHPILDFFGMREFYKNDPVSTDVLERKLPHLYVVIPDVKITFLKKDPSHVFVTYAYPTMAIQKEFFLSESGVKGLRRTFSKGKKGWEKVIFEETCGFFHKGGLFAPLYTRFSDRSK